MIAVERIGTNDVDVMEAANSLFLEVFADEAYLGPLPSRQHLGNLLADPRFIALVGQIDGVMVGALAGYQLVKYEAERSEIYIYDLAVREAFRRRGVATALIEALRPIARACGAHVIFVQADPVDAPAVALYDKLGTREHVLHFDISPAAGRSPTR